MSITSSKLNQKSELKLLFLVLVFFPLLGTGQALTKHTPQLLYEEPGGLFDLA